MLRRIISLAVVCVGLLLAGSPAAACASNVPLKDCCPSEPGGSCREAADQLATPGQAACCAAGTTTPVATASLSLPSDLEKHPAGGNVPAAIDSSLPHATTGWRSPASTVGWEATSYSRSGSVLYLSTGRLRL